MVDALTIAKNVRFFLKDDDVFPAIEVSNDIDYLYRDEKKRCVQAEFGLAIGAQVFTVTIKESRF